MRLGIRVRLGSAFGVVTVMLVVSTLAANHTFGLASWALDRIVAEDVPRIVSAKTLAQVSERITGQVPRLADARTQADRRTAIEELARQTAELRRLLNDVGGGTAEREALAAALAETESNTARIDTLVTQSLADQEVQRELLAKAGAVMTEIRRLLEPLRTRWQSATDRAKADLEQPGLADGRLGILAKTMVHAIDAVQPLDGIEREIVGLSGTLTEIVGALDNTRLDVVAMRVDKTFERLRSVMEKLDPRLQASLQPLLAELDKQMRATDGIVGRQRWINDAAAERTRLVESNRTTADRLAQSASQVAALSAQEIAQVTAEARAAVTSSRAVMMGFAIAGVVASLLIAWLYVGRNLTNRLIRLETVMLELARGNLEVTVATDGNDEITAMARVLQVFKDNAVKVQSLSAEQESLKRDAERQRRETTQRMADSFETGVTELVERLAAASQRMQEAANTMSASIDDASQRSTTVAAASEHASENVQTVAAAATELSSAISEIGRQAGHSTRIAAMATEAAARTDATVKGMAEAANRIGEVVALINSIAGQTNLLALNATIEAARAGDAGKGFAVVASEVKNLAGQTAKATEEIAGQVGDIQSVTDEAVAAIRSIGDIIQELNGIAVTISAAVEQQGAATQEIARNVQLAATGTHEVSSNISGVRQAVMDTGTLASDVQQAAGALNDSTTRLRQQVRVFLDSVQAA
ncbi:MAG TPA: HAMP domain-containing methyl-accepting chemotaxis protein [Azospirillaceae bacterium]|nr:HAMP domain-containing methyl-accepting chemotaxis protein [Azospirillaceae bacterium]